MYSHIRNYRYIKGNFLTQPTVDSDRAVECSMNCATAHITVAHVAHQMPMDRISVKNFILVKRSYSSRPEKTKISKNLKQIFTQQPTSSVHISKFAFSQNQ